MSTVPSSTDASALVAYYQHHAIPQRYNAGLVFASVAVSIIGSYTTLLLLGRRTSNKGLRNFALLTIAATTMGSVGIWGMHFMGMRMKFEPAPGVFWWLDFHPAWTIFSLFVPLFALILAFVFLGTQTKLSYWRILISGLIFGGIVCLMHYTAAFNANFSVSYNPGYVALSVILACLSATVALVVFFRMRNQWQDNWWKRLLIATLLAGGVCSMHYSAVGGTSYYVKPSHVTELTHGRSKSVIMSIAIAAMCLALCLISILVVIIDVQHEKRLQKTGKEIFVASATFDKKGNLLVKSDGTLPLQVIKTKDMPKDILNELDNRKSTFQWLYSLSWDWTILEPFADRIAARACRQNLTRQSSKLFPAKSTADKEMADPLEDFPGEGPDGSRSKRLAALYQSGNYLPLHSASLQQVKASRKKQALDNFKDKFLESSFLLANEFDLNYTKIGLLFDRVIETGTFADQPQGTSAPNAQDEEKAASRNNSNLSLPLSVSAGKKGDTYLKKGGMLILVREISETGNDTVDKYLDKGYRFSDPKFYSPILSSKFGIERSEVAGLLKELRIFSKRGNKPVVQPNGTYVGLFAIRARDDRINTSSTSAERDNDMETLVYSFARHQIPAYRLPDISNIANVSIVRDWLNSLSGKTLEYVKRKALEDSLRYNEQMAAQERRRAAFFNSTGQESHHEDEPLGLESGLSLEEQLELSTFQSSFYVAIDAMLLALQRNIIQDLPLRATLSSEVLEVPSSLDDSSAPAQMIMFRTVLPPATTTTSYQSNAKDDFAKSSHERKGSGSSISSFSSIPRYGDTFTSVPTFVFTPFSLFDRAQTSLLKGKCHKDLNREIRLELIQRFTPGNGKSDTKTLNRGPSMTSLGVRGMLDGSTFAPSVTDRKLSTVHQSSEGEPKEELDIVHISLEKNQGRISDVRQMSPNRRISTALSVSTDSEPRNEKVSPLGSPRFGNDMPKPARVSVGPLRTPAVEALSRPGSSRPGTGNTYGPSPPSSGDNAAYQMMLAAFHNTTGSMSTFRPAPSASIPSLPPSSPPPSHPLPLAPMSQRMVSEEQSFYDSSSPSRVVESGEAATSQHVRQPSDGTSLRSAATAARYRSDGWVNRAMVEMEHDNTSSRASSSAW